MTASVTLRATSRRVATTASTAIRASRRRPCCSTPSVASPKTPAPVRPSALRSRCCATAAATERRSRSLACRRATVAATGASHRFPASPPFVVTTSCPSSGDSVCAAEDRQLLASQAQLRVGADAILDHEACDRYEVTIKASAVDTPERSSVAVITVAVDDVDDARVDTMGSGNDVSRRAGYEGGQNVFFDGANSATRAARRPCT